MYFQRRKYFLIFCLYRQILMTWHHEPTVLTTEINWILLYFFRSINTLIPDSVVARVPSFNLHLWYYWSSPQEFYRRHALISKLLSDLWGSGHEFEPTIRHSYQFLEGQLQIWGAHLHINRNSQRSKLTPRVKETEGPEKKNKMK